MAILGVLVGGLVIAMYLPIFKLARSSATAAALDASTQTRPRGVSRPMGILEGEAPAWVAGRGRCSACWSAASSTSSSTACRSCWSGSGSAQRARSWASRRCLRPADPRVNLVVPRSALPAAAGADHGGAEHPGRQLPAARRQVPRAAARASRRAIRSSSWSPAAFRPGAWTVRLRLVARRRAVLTWFLIALTGIDLDHSSCPTS